MSITGDNTIAQLFNIVYILHSFQYSSYDNQLVLVTWMALAEPNGIITGYTLTNNVEGLLNVSVHVSLTGEIVCTNKCFNIHIYVVIHIFVCKF